MAKPIADILVADHGSVYLFIYQSEVGRDFLQDECETESWQWLGSNLAVDHGVAAGLVAAMIDHGLTVDSYH